MVVVPYSVCISDFCSVYTTTFVYDLFGYINDKETRHHHLCSALFHAYYYRMDYFTRCRVPSALPLKTQFISTSPARLFLCEEKKRPPREHVSTSFALVAPSRHDSGHHLLLGNQVVDAFQVVQEALHVTAPFIQHVVRVTRLGKADQPSWAVNLGVNRLRCDQVANVLLGLFLSQVQKLRQTTHLDPCVVFGHHPHIVLDNTLPEVLPSSKRLVVGSRTRLSFKDVRLAQVRSELLRNHGPAHQFGDRKELH